MPSLKVDQIKQVLKGGVRSNLFQITVNRTASGINVPALPFGDNGQNLSVLVRAGQIPALYHCTNRSSFPWNPIQDNWRENIRAMDHDSL